MQTARVGLGQLLLALDATLVSLVDAPRGLDLPVGSAALIDSDDVRLGLAAGAGSADVFFLLGVSEDEAVRWLDGQARAPVAIFAKGPSPALVATAVAAGSAVVAVEPRARWERLYQLVNHVLEHHGDRGDPVDDSGTDLFGLAQSLADRIHGMVSIENAQSQVLAYSASNDEADELRRLSILGRAGPPEHLEWIGQWGIFDALRSSGEVVRVAERPELGLRPRLAIGIHQPPAGARRPPVFAGAIWVQQGSQPLADDADEMLRGAAVLAARIMARLAARPSTHARRVQQLLGLTDEPADAAAVAHDLGLTADGAAALVGWDTHDTGTRHPRLADVVALSASAFRRDAQVASRGSRIYVLLPQTAPTRSVTSWVRGTIGALRTELGVELRAAIAAPIAGLTEVAAARTEVDRVLDSAERHPLLGQVTTLAEARTTVLLDEIVTLVGSDKRLVDPRIRELREQDPLLVETLRAHLDSFGDVGAAAHALRVHPNTVRYRVRRIEKLLGTSLSDPEVRLLFSLGLRVTERPA
jgi:DNA-binding PucR family transcriptional regulator